ncbi:lipopolysaccharide biosynthesis protein [Lachnobacterium bovis]|uniref:lipopolysaccharide biosynthesis protein n=1 Tax=Lachnobacterium bovis TaxID=140626 RepID=UPI00068A468A|nr:lipopolysaccharide biosynthesis protein [Lachnobacterium bovis]
MHDDIKKSIIKGIGWKFAERIIAQGVSFIVSIILARILMPDDYGMVAIVFLFITLADVLVSSGLGTALIQDKNVVEDDFSTIFYCSLFISICLYMIMFVSAPLIEHFYKIQGLTIVLRVFSLRIILGAYNTIQHAYIVKKMEFQKFFWATLIGTMISAFLGIYLAVKGYGVWALVMQYLSNSVMDSVVLSFIIKWYPKRVFSIKRAKVLVGYGWKIMCADFIGTFFNQIQTVFIGGYYNATQLAFYNKGNQIPNAMFNNITGTISSVLFSAFSKVEDKLKKKKLIRQVIKKLSFVIFPGLAVMYTISDTIIIGLFTAKWARCVEFMKYGILSIPFFLIGEISIQIVKATGRSDIVLKIELVKKPLYLILILIGMKKSVIAIAQMTCLYSVVVAIINLYVMGKLIGYKGREILSDLLWPSFTAIVMAVILTSFNSFLKMGYIKVLFNAVCLVVFYMFKFGVNNKGIVFKLKGEKYEDSEKV